MPTTRQSSRGAKLGKVVNQCLSIAHQGKMTALYGQSQLVFLLQLSSLAACFMNQHRVSSLSNLKFDLSSLVICVLPNSLVQPRSLCLTNAT